jgi:hypothetical protein
VSLLGVCCRRRVYILYAIIANGKYGPDLGFSICGLWRPPLSSVTLEEAASCADMTEKILKDLDRFTEFESNQVIALLIKLEE